MHTSFSRLRRPQRLLWLCISTCSLSLADWSFRFGIQHAYQMQSFDMLPHQMPTVNNSGATAFAGSTVSGNTYPLMLIEDMSYSDRLWMSTQKNFNPFIVAETDISEAWSFRLRAARDSNASTVLNVATMIYTPDSSQSLSLGSAQLPNIMSNSYETLTLSTSASANATLSFLYRISDRFAAGPAFTQHMPRYTLSLNNTYSQSFKPLVGSLGIETLFQISPHTVITSSFQFSKKTAYVKRLLNFQVNSNADGSYSLSYIPVQSPAWQACTGYSVDNSVCTSPTSNSSSVNNYYYNADTPSIYGSSIATNSINTTLGPQAWFNQFLFRTTLAIEWSLDSHWLKKSSYRSKRS